MEIINKDTFNFVKRLLLLGFVVFESHIKKNLSLFFMYLKLLLLFFVLFKISQMNKALKIRLQLNFGKLNEFAMTFNKHLLPWIESQGL